MRRVVVWCVVGALPWMVGCRQNGAQGQKAGKNPLAAVSGTAMAAEQAEARPAVPPPPPAPMEPPATEAENPPEAAPRQHVGKEIVIAWEASLIYLLKDGKPTGKPLIVNGAKHKYLREKHLGEFKITEKRRLKRSNLYDVKGDPLPDRDLAESRGAVMRNWMRIGDLAVGLHYSPAFRFHRNPSNRHRSHGCYRMSRKDSDMVYEWAPVGTPVYVVRSLAGTEWASLRDITPPELLPNYTPPSKATAHRVDEP